MSSDSRFTHNASVQRRSGAWFPVIVSLACVALLLPACAQKEIRPSFGDRYEIIVNDIPGAPDKPPRMVGDWLLLMVAYAGGCADHQFQLNSAIRQDTAHIWIAHENGGDSCEAYITDDLSLKLSPAVLNARVIAMHDPAGEPPHLLKW